MKFNVLAVLALLASSVLTNNCGPNCISCGDAGCTLCLGYKLVNGICDLAQPVEEGCEAYGVYNRALICYFCKAGFILDDTTGVCKKAAQMIDKCFIQTVNPSFCEICSNSVPDQWLSYCVPSSLKNCVKAGL